jgi:DNA-directed RNA polymerase subunit beta'
LQDVVNPLTNDISSIWTANYRSNYESSEASPIESVEVRSPLVCEAPKGICAKCYGRNLLVR